MRAFIRGWSRGRRDRQLVACVYVAACVDGQPPGLREVSRQTGVGFTQVRKYIAEFTREIRAARIAEEALGLPALAWVEALARPDDE